MYLIIGIERNHDTGFLCPIRTAVRSSADANGGKANGIGANHGYGGKTAGAHRRVAPHGSVVMPLLPEVAVSEAGHVVWVEPSGVKGSGIGGARSGSKGDR